MKKFGMFIVIGILFLAVSGCNSAVKETPMPTNTVKPAEQAPDSTATQILVPESSPTVEPVVEQTFMDKVAIEDIRLFDYNVNWDSIFPDDDPENHEWRSAEKVDEFRRLIQAVSPDIACLQEINPDRDPGEVSAIFDEVLPLGGTQQWQAVSVHDSVIVSKYQILTDGYGMSAPYSAQDLLQAAALIDLPDDSYQTDLYLICAHFAAYGDQEAINKRQTQADALMQQVEDLKTIGDDVDLVPDTPFVLAGDFNVYSTDPAHHLVTMVTGDIVYENQFGADIQPDWDDTDLTDVQPSHQGEGLEFYTWRDDDSGFDAFPLDHVIYSDSVMSVSNAFILNTKSLDSAYLMQYDLQEDDIMIDPSTGVYDHLPIVVDFVISGN